MPGRPVAADSGGEDDGRRPSPFAGIPGGPLVGTFVHRVLEEVDFAAPDLTAALGSAIATAGHQEGAPPGMVGLEVGLRAALTTPLGPLLPGVALADVGRADRLDELWFELPVAGGETPEAGSGRKQCGRRTWPPSCSPPTSRPETGSTPTPIFLLDPQLETTPPRLSDRQPRPRVPEPGRDGWNAPLVRGRLQDQLARRLDGAPCPWPTTPRAGSTPRCTAATTPSRR